MKRVAVLFFMTFAVGCSSSNKSAAGGTGTSMQASWSVTGSLNSGGNQTYQVVLISSPCSVATPVGTFSVQGPVCFIANNNSGQGSISGTGPKGTSQGVLVGVAANPVADGGTVNLLFVAAEQGGNFAKFLEVPQSPGAPLPEPDPAARTRLCVRA